MFMTETEKRLTELSPELKDKINGMFGSTDALYETAYLIAQNGHILQNEHPQAWEQKLQNIQYYQERLEAKLDDIGLDGKELFADIASDYFEDFVNYRNREMKIDDAQFIHIIKKLR